MIAAGLLGEFETADGLARAAAALRRAGYARLDACSPYAVPGLGEALGSPRSPLPLVVLAAALLGGALAYAVQWYTNAWDYPLVAGGRPAHAAPAFVPIALEIAVLAGGVAALAGLLVATRLPALWHPVFEVEGFERASVDRFWLGVDATDPRFDREATRRDLETAGALRVVALPVEDTEADGGDPGPPGERGTP